jgi:hypothetical protein
VSDSHFQPFRFRLVPETARLGVIGAFLVENFQNRTSDPACDDLAGLVTRFCGGRMIRLPRAEDTTTAKL